MVHSTYEILRKLIRPRVEVERLKLQYKYEIILETVNL